MYVRILFLFFLVSTTQATNAYAYLDPGAGSYVFQVVASVFLVSLFFMKNFFKRVFQVLKNIVFLKGDGKDGES